MGILRGFEKRLEGLVEGFFARALPGGGVQPVELGKRMVRAMEEERTVAATGTSYVPNSFAFRIAPKDFARLSQIMSTLRKELTAVARRAASSEGWRMVGPPEIQVLEDAGMKSGTFAVDASFVESATPEPEAGPQTQLIQMSLDADAELVQLGKTSRTWPLSKETVVIGRMEGCDVILPDPGVSRRHAEIRREGDEWVVIDLGSTNGTEVNGKRVNRHRLTPGDRLVFGETALEFRRP
ncbi:MAG: FhaA domain-containing protein [Actinomycetota bacterium]